MGTQKGRKERKGKGRGKGKGEGREKKRKGEGKIGTILMFTPPADNAGYAPG